MPKKKRRTSAHLTWSSHYQRRSKVALFLRVDEFEDLRQIAEAWDIPVATAGWAILSNYFSTLRNQAPSLGSIPLKASRHIVAQQNKKM